MKTATKVRVTAALIRRGIAGDCHRCAVALAVRKAMGDAECMVAEVEWTLRLRVWSRWIIVPWEVRWFVYTIDSLGRKSDGRPQLRQKLSEYLAPFEFTLPPFDDPAWEEQCCGCEDLFDRTELDEEGLCEDCRKGENEEHEPR
jgi:hypothetical protein